MNASVKGMHDSDGLQFFCRHLVALCVTFDLKGSDQTDRAPRFAAYSGTLIQIQNTVFYLTAGHILRDLENALNSDKVSIKGAVLADTFGLGRVSDHPIPFDLKNARLFYIDDDEEGLDFGVILLGPYYVRLLAANGVVALQEENWIHQGAVRFDGHLMLGLPEEFTSDSVPASGECNVSPTMFGVRQLDSLPEGVTTTRYPRFIGQIHPELPLKSVKGMSGGPIIGFRRQPEMRYWVVALQSSWKPTQRIVVGCPLPVLASLMTGRGTEQAPTS